MKKGLLLVLFFCLLANSAWAKTEKGFRLSLGFTPGIDEVEFSDAGTSSTVELDSDSGINFNPMFAFRTNVERPVGFVGAVGLFVRSHSGTDIVGDEAELTAYGVNFQPGLTVNFSKRAHLEFKAEIALGGADQSITGFTDGNGPYYAFGVSAGSYFKITDVFVLGGDINYTDFTSEGEVDLGSNVIDSDFTGSGVGLNVSIGFMF